MILGTLSRRFAVFGLILAGLGGTAHAAEQRINGLGAVYAGGFRIVDMRWTATLNERSEDYRIETEVRLTGWLEWLIDFEANHSADGKLSGVEVLPDRFTTRGVLGDERRRTDVRFGAVGPLDVSVEPVDPPDVRDPVPQDALAGTLDPLSLFLRNARREDPLDVCASPPPFFDGRRVVAIQLEPLGWETLEASNEARYSGEAFKCGVTHEVLAGQYKGDWPGKGEPVEVSHIWIAKPKDSPIWQPIRLERSTGFGTVIAHLEEIEITGERKAARLAD